MTCSDGAQLKLNSTMKTEDIPEKTQGNAFETKIGDTQYCNTEYLEHERFMLLTDSQEIEATMNSVSSNVVDRGEVTGVLATASNGDFDEIWVTTENNPYLGSAEYTRVL